MYKLLLACLILFLLSCQKEVEPNQVDDQRQNSNCKLQVSRTHNIFGALLGDSAIYYYKGNDVHKITGGDPADSVVFEYSGRNIIKRRHISSGVLIGYDDLFYNNDGTIKKIITYNEDLGTGGIELYDSTVFSYSGGKISKRNYYCIDLQGPGLILEEENQFVFSGNNITKEIRFRYNSSGGIDQRDTSILEYDSQPNLLKKQAFPHLQANPMFLDSFAYYLAFLLSENNVISGMISDDPSSKELFTYVKDAKGNVVQINADGIALLSYKYSCP